MMQETFNVPDVSCGHCKATIEGALATVAGVSAAEVDVEGRLVAVSYDEGVVDRTSVVRAIESSGYPIGA